MCPVGLQIFVCTVREQGWAVASVPRGPVALCGEGGTLSVSVCLRGAWKDPKAKKL